MDPMFRDFFQKPTQKCGISSYVLKCEYPRGTKYRMFLVDSTGFIVRCLQYKISRAYFLLDLHITLEVIMFGRKVSERWCKCMELHLHLKYSCLAEKWVKDGASAWNFIYTWSIHVWQQSEWKMVQVHGTSFRE